MNPNSNSTPVLACSSNDETASAAATNHVLNIGDRFRSERRRQRMSLDQIARIAAISKSYLVQIERNTRRPSSLVLDRIAKALRIPDKALFEIGNENYIVTRKEDWSQFPIEGSDHKVASLTMQKYKSPLEVQLIHLPAGTSSSKIKTVAVEEFIHIVSGTIILNVTGQHFELRAGDSFSTRGASMREWTNSAPCESVVLWVTV